MKTGLKLNKIKPLPIDDFFAEYIKDVKDIHGFEILAGKQNLSTMQNTSQFLRKSGIFLENKIGDDQN